MMEKLPFYIVDVFAEEKFAGNQLAVFRNAGKLQSDEMQSIAREMHFSETAFILSETEHDGGYDVRIFTPGEEVPFAGHPTLGTVHILRTEIIRKPCSLIVLNLKVGRVPVTFNQDEKCGTVYWMEQKFPEFGGRFTAEKLARALSLEPEEIDCRFPIEEVSTGLPHILVPLKTLDSLKKAKIDHDRYFDLIRSTWAKPVMIFCPEPHLPGNDISVRMFADCFGISEDPATGSGNGCLAGYLVKHRYYGKTEISIRSEQGYEIGRPSLLLLRAKEKHDGIEVRVGGKAITIAKGKFI